jgi:two-component system, OmpR family, torCAD operon response regulator TorR
MNDERHVLIVEDDEVSSARLAGYIEAAGYRVTEVSDGTKMADTLEEDPADLILLDINLPGEDGIDLTRQIRNRSNVGIILVTARTDEVDRIVGLEIGADDYITKPFNPRELLARVKSLLRRIHANQSPDWPMKRFKGWTLDTRTRTLSNNKNDRMHLTRAEFELLDALVGNPGMVMTRDRLLNKITHRSWDPTDRTIDVLVRRVRRKIEANPKKPEIIKTAHGEGYIFTAEIEEY